jgi:hypothetical protein
MKATIDIPDQCYRQVKARAALDGRSVRDVTIELYEDWLAAPRDDSGSQADAAATWLARWDEVGDEIAKAAVDPRTTREILLAERR